MAPNFQSSFIPKEPITDTGFKKKSVGLIGIIVITFFTISIIGAIGVYVYKGMVKSNIESLKAELGSAEKNIDKKTIDEMWVFSKKLNVVRDIINKHQVVSNVLSIISSSTVSSVYFGDFSYSTDFQGNLSVILRGRAQSYGSVALQESLLSQNKYFKSISFGNLGLVDGGLVSFDLTIMVDPQVSIYNKESPVSAVLEDLESEVATGVDDIDINLDDIDISLPDL